MNTQSGCNLKNTATVNCHLQTGVQSKYKFYIFQYICKLNMKTVILNFTQWNSKSSTINIKCPDIVRWLPGALPYEFLIIKDIFKKHDLWHNMSLKLPDSDIELCRVKFLILDRSKWLNAWIFFVPWALWALNTDILKWANWDSLNRDTEKKGVTPLYVFGLNRFTIVYSSE